MSISFGKNRLFEKKLNEQKQKIVKKWFDMTVESYPPDTAAFLKRQSDPFANPVGQTTSRRLSDLFDALMEGSDRDQIASILDPVIKIRALQAFAPSQAIFFVQGLKRIVRDLFSDSEKSAVLAELLNFESVIDSAGFIAFDIFMENREKMYDLKATEVRNRTFVAFERAGLVGGGDLDEPADGALPSCSAPGA